MAETQGHRKIGRLSSRCPLAGFSISTPQG